jgi:hypothetical protein
MAASKSFSNLEPVNLGVPLSNRAQRSAGQGRPPRDGTRRHATDVACARPRRFLRGRGTSGAQVDTAEPGATRALRCSSCLVMSHGRNTGTNYGWARRPPVRQATSRSATYNRHYWHGDRLHHRDRDRGCRRDSRTQHEAGAAGRRGPASGEERATRSCCQPTFEPEQHAGCPSLDRPCRAGWARAWHPKPVPIAHGAQPQAGATSTKNFGPNKLARRAALVLVRRVPAGTSKTPPWLRTS